MSVSSRTRQRKPVASTPSSDFPPRSSSLPSSTPTMSPSSPIPTSAELLFLSIFPLTLALGSLYSLICPSCRAAPYSFDLQSHLPSAAPSYFARKSNVFNRYFVKVGWGWVTFAFAVYLLSRIYVLASSNRPPITVHTLRHKLLHPVLRWSLLTAWWFAVTQRFFGPPIIDRGFCWTGGHCEVSLGKGPADMARGEADLETLVTAAACRALGGAWRGGHDISGHAFLLILGSAFLGLEVGFRVLDRWTRESNGAAGKNTRGNAEAEEEETIIVRWAEYFVAAVGGMNLWMLLMTALYFHTWFEKLTGLVTAFAGIAVVYFLPRAVLALKTVVGSPAL